MAKAGDTTAIRLCLERLLPPARDRGIRISLPVIKSTGDVLSAIGEVLQAVATGELTPMEAQNVAGLLESYRRTAETTAIEERITERGEGKPETFVFLGFTHYCGHLRSSGAFTVWRITATKRMVAKLKAIKAELQRRKHHRTSEVGEWLRKIVLGYYQYHAVPGNSSQLRLFRRRVCRLWRSLLVRRSQRAQVRWGRLAPLMDRWIPPPRILHPHPGERFNATHSL